MQQLKVHTRRIDANLMSSAQKMLHRLLPRYHYDGYGEKRYDVSYTQDLSCSVNNLGLVRWSEIRVRDAGSRTRVAVRD